MPRPAPKRGGASLASPVLDQHMDLPLARNTSKGLARLQCKI